MATIAGGIGLKLAEKRINKLGKFKIYASFERIQKDGVIIKFELINAKNSPYIVRDLNLIRFEGNTIKYYIQGEYTETEQRDGSITKEYYCNNGSYSFVVPQQTTKQVKCIFIDTTQQFDFENGIYYINFYDERGIAHIYDINKKNKVKDNKWIELKEINGNMLLNG